jgi:hypothetical protein
VITKKKGGASKLWGSGDNEGKNVGASKLWSSSDNKGHGGSDDKE